MSNNSRAVLEHHPDGALTHLGRELQGRLVILHGSNLSRSGASGKPGAVQSAPKPGMGGDCILYRMDTSRMAKTVKIVIQAAANCENGST